MLHISGPKTRVRCMRLASNGELHYSPLSSITPPAGTAITQISELPDSLDEYATILPSGDHDGHETPEPRTRGVDVPESRDTIQMTDSAESVAAKMNVVPSGEQHG